MKLYPLWTLLSLLVFAAFSGCDNLGALIVEPPAVIPAIYIPDDLVGTWINVLDSSDKVDLPNDANTVELERIKGSSTYLLITRKIGNNRVKTFYLRAEDKANVTGQINQISSSGTLQKVSGRAGGHGVANIGVVLKNVGTKKEIHTNTDDSGQFTAQTPPGKFTLEANDADGNTVSTVIDVKSRELDLGAYTLTPKDSYNFKTSINFDGAPEYLFGSLEEYTGALTISNVGTKNASGLNIDVDCKHKFINSCTVIEKNLAIPAQQSAQLKISIRFNLLEKDVENIRFPISITDFNGRVWLDYVSVTVYRRGTYIRTWTGDTSIALNAALTFPDGSVRLFKDIRSLYVPYFADKFYTVNIVNYSIGRETAYNIAYEKAAKAPPIEIDTRLDETWPVPAPLSPGEDAMAYIAENDIDVFQLYMPTENVTLDAIKLSTTREPVFIDTNTAGHPLIKGNGDGVFNPGESAIINFGIENTGLFNATEVKVEVTTSSPYLTVTSALKNNVSFPSTSVTGRTSHDLFGNVDPTQYNKISSAGTYFTLSAAKDVPSDYENIVYITLTDKYGNAWKSQFKVNVSPVNAEPLFFNWSRAYDISNVPGDTKGNGDSIINRGEKIRANLAIKNAKPSTVLGATIELQVESNPYVAITSERAQNGGPIKITIPGNATIDTQGRLSDSAAFLQVAEKTGFLIDVKPETPEGFVANILMSITDTFGKNWQSTFPLTIQPIDAQLVLGGVSKIQDKTSGTIIVGNNNAILNVGEKAAFNVSIKNTGNSLAMKVEMSLSSTDPSVDFNYYGQGVLGRKPIVSAVGGKTIDAAGKESGVAGYLDGNSFPFIVNVHIDATPHTVPIELKMTDEFNNTWTDAISLKIE